MDWKVLKEARDLDDLMRMSYERPQVIFKHSIRCSISAVAKGRLDRATAPEHVDFYYLDLVTYRSLSNKIAEVFDVRHESPQVLVIRNGSCVYEESHMGISVQEILEQAAF